MLRLRTRMIRSSDQELWTVNVVNTLCTATGTGDANAYATPRNQLIIDLVCERRI